MNKDLFDLFSEDLYIPKEYTIIENGNQVIKSGTGKNIHTYIDVYGKITPNTDAVIECEFKLGEDFDYPSSLFQVIDRSNVDTGANFFLALLNVNKDGGVYYSKNDSHLLCG